VPFLVVKIVRSLHQSQVFEHQNLKRIQRIGIILLVVGILSSVLQFINIESAKSVIDLLHYQFSYSKVIDFNLLILGIIVLIMNEILRIGTEMKEEQDLTI
jgi:multidrug transporter EmrE-like cation transporter